MTPPAHRAGRAGAAARGRLAGRRRARRAPAPAASAVRPSLPPLLLLGLGVWAGTAGAYAGAARLDAGALPWLAGGALALVALRAARTLDVLALGEVAATGLGVDVRRSSLGLLAVAVGCSGLCCAVGGGLTFVGLVCPHLARRLVGPRHRVLIPATILVGAVLMLAADIISRTLLMPNEIPVGIVAAVIGAPYFLYLLAKA